MLRGLSSVFEGLADVRILGTTHSVLDVPAVIDQLHPDVLLLGATTPDEATFDLIDAATAMSPTTKVIVLANAAPTGALLSAVRAGVAGYLRKDVDPPALIAAVRAVAAGGASLDGASAKALLDSVRDLARSGLFPTDGLPSELSRNLTERDRTIAHLIAAGLTNRQIGEVLKLSPHTVKAYVSQILEKLGVSRRAAIAALDPKILDVRPPEGPSHHE